MADESKPDKAETKPGFNAPIKVGEKLPDYVAEDTRMAKGVAPDSKEIISLNLGVLQAKHGKKEGLDRYTRIAKAGGFYDPSTEPVGSTFFPDLQLEGMSKAAREAVDAILNEKE